MTGFWAIYKREMLSLWVTPVAWILLVTFLLLQGGVFYSIVSHYSGAAELSFDNGPIEAYFGQGSIFLLVTLLLLCPALSMRLFSEERRSGTIESLLTAPVRALSIVLGKYLATLSTYILMWSPTLLYPFLLRDTGVVDGGVVFTSYLGLLLLGAAYLAVGTLMSALTQSQLSALMLTVLLQFGMFVLGVGEYIFDPGLLHSICSHVSMMSHMEEFSKGIIDLRRVVFDLSVVVLALFTTTEVVDSWRWS
ncbi:MAG: ABC transporter permease [Polyangiaceae bacterium]|nr:ABC transporter permease [Polyangiaceae bacterium]